MKLLVTGAAGFIGSHLVDRLVQLGHEVIAIDNESATENDFFFWNDGAKNYKLDICDYSATNHLYAGVDVVFHLASSSRIQPSIKNPNITIKNNVFGTANVLRSCIEHNVKKIIFSSTSSIYGNGLIPNVEDNEPNCLNVYSKTKLLGEEMFKLLNNHIQSVSLRYFNVYGDRQPTKGEYATVVGRFLKQKLSDMPLTIVGDGSKLRCFTHVDDIVNTNILFMENNSKEIFNGNVYNVASSSILTISELANLISDKQIFINERIAEHEKSLPVVDKLFNALGWKPSIEIKDWLQEQSLKQS